MGCSGSKAENSITEVQPNKNHASEVAAPPPQKHHYNSDVDNAKSSAVTGLVHASDAKSMLKKYDLGNGTELGRGACGSVSAVKHKETGDMFALKKVSFESMDAVSWEELEAEVDTQKKLDHPNVARILESFKDNDAKVMYIVMELCSGGSLVSRMRKHRHGYNERMAASMMEKMLSAVTYCHHHGVVHRDIKLDNIMYESDAEDGELKLIDFGFAADVKKGGEGMWDQLGTPSYMAPELWADVEKEYDSSVDVWAIGVLTYLLLCGRRPFDHPNRAEKKRMIEHDKLQFPSPYWDKISSEAKDFCQALMQKKPKDRLSAAEALKHPWIKHQSTGHSGTDAAQELLAHDEIFGALEAYEHTDALARLSLQVMAFSTPPAKTHELREMFKKFDTDDSGTISMSEFKQALQTSHPELSEERVEAMFKSLDFESKGEIEYLEFVAATMSSQKNLAGSNSILAAFNVLDVDHDGVITKADIAKAFSGQIDDKVADALMKHRNESGAVNFKSFERAILAMIKESGEHADGAHHVIRTLSPKLHYETKNM